MRYLEHIALRNAGRGTQGYPHPFGRPLQPCRRNPRIQDNQHMIRRHRGLLDKSRASVWPLLQSLFHPMQGMFTVSLNQPLARKHATRAHRTFPDLEYRCTGIAICEPSCRLHGSGGAGGGRPRNSALLSPRRHPSRTATRSSICRRIRKPLLLRCRCYRPRFGDPIRPQHGQDRDAREQESHPDGM